MVKVSNCLLWLLGGNNVFGTTSKVPSTEILFPISVGLEKTWSTNSGDQNTTAQSRPSSGSMTSVFTQPASYRTSWLFSCSPKTFSWTLRGTVSPSRSNRLIEPFTFSNSNSMDISWDLSVEKLFLKCTCYDPTRQRRDFSRQGNIFSMHLSKNLWKLCIGTTYLGCDNVKVNEKSKLGVWSESQLRFFPQELSRENNDQCKIKVSKLSE